MLFGFVSGAYATDIQLTWTAPTQYENGASISEIDAYNLYYSIDNVQQAPVSIDGLDSGYLLRDVVEGSYTFQISTVAGETESDLSNPVNVDVIKSKPVKIEITVQVIE
jgi:hypothetical protein